LILRCQQNAAFEVPKDVQAHALGNAHADLLEKAIGLVLAEIVKRMEKDAVLTYQPCLLDIAEMCKLPGTLPATGDDAFTTAASESSAVSVVNPTPAKGAEGDPSTAMGDDPSALTGNSPSPALTESSPSPNLPMKIMDALELMIDYGFPQSARELLEIMQARPTSTSGSAHVITPLLIRLQLASANVLEFTGLPGRRQVFKQRQQMIEAIERSRDAHQDYYYQIVFSALCDNVAGLTEFYGLEVGEMALLRCFFLLYKATSGDEEKMARQYAKCYDKAAFIAVNNGVSNAVPYVHRSLALMRDRPRTAFELHIVRMCIHWREFVEAMSILGHVSRTVDQRSSFYGEACLYLGVIYHLQKEHYRAEYDNTRTRRSDSPTSS
jgi:hypothetical protein